MDPTAPADKPPVAPTASRREAPGFISLASALDWTPRLNFHSAEARPMSQATSDRNLLFGILALQMDFVRRDDLIGAMNAWVLDKARPLGQILCDRGNLAEERRVLLDALVQAHLKQHGDDPQQSLAAVSAPRPLRDALKEGNDPDVQ